MEKLEYTELKFFLDQKAGLFNRPSYIESDPIQVPHRFTTAEDIEIAAFLTATIAWGNRKSIIKNAFRLISLMDNAPFQFITNGMHSETKRLEKFVHRTFSGSDAIEFVFALQSVCAEHQSLGGFFKSSWEKHREIREVLIHFRQEFYKNIPFKTSGRHLSDVSRGSAAKRLNMFLRWMVRNDRCGVDFGLWDFIPPAALYIPLDVHSGRVARKLGMLHRNQDDWKAVEELTMVLRELDPADPVKYDFALFGLGVFEGFK